MVPRQDPKRLYTTTELADELGVTPRAIRFYESKGLLEPQRAGANRVYTLPRPRAAAASSCAASGSASRSPLIQQYLDLYDADPTHKKQLVHLLRGARQRIDELESQRHDLELTLEELREIEQRARRHARPGCAAGRSTRI